MRRITLIKAGVEEDSIEEAVVEAVKDGDKSHSIDWFNYLL